MIIPACWQSVISKRLSASIMIIMVWYVRKGTSSLIMTGTRDLMWRQTLIKASLLLHHNPIAILRSGPIIYIDMFSWSQNLMLWLMTLLLLMSIMTVLLWGRCMWCLMRVSIRRAVSSCIWRSFRWLLWKFMMYILIQLGLTWRRSSSQEDNRFSCLFMVWYVAQYSFISLYSFVNLKIVYC